MTSSATRSGYIFVLSVLFVGAIAITTTATLIILGIAAQRNGLALQQSEQAFLNAQTCIERALRSLRGDAAYAGNETLVLTRGTCLLLPIGGNGNNDRSICARGSYSSAVRRTEASVAQVLSSTTITSWQEVSSFALCNE